MYFAQGLAVEVTNQTNFTEGKHYTVLALEYEEHSSPGDNALIRKTIVLLADDEGKFSWVNENNLTVVQR